MRSDRSKTMLFVACLFVQLFICAGCKKHPGRKVSDKELLSIKKSCSPKIYPVGLYYLDGNCSFCLAKAKEFDDKKHNEGTGCVIIFQTSNPVMTKMYIRDISLQSCVILDSVNTFTKSFSLNTIYGIAENGEILSEKSDE